MKVRPPTSSVRSFLYSYPFSRSRKSRRNHDGQTTSKTDPIESIQAELLPCLQSLEFRGIQKFSWNCLADFIIAGLAEDSTNSPIADIDRNLSVLQRNRNSIRLVFFIVRNGEPIIDLDMHARNNGVSVELWMDSQTRCYKQYDSLHNPLYPEPLKIIVFCVETLGHQIL